MCACVCVRVCLNLHEILKCAHDSNVQLLSFPIARHVMLEFYFPFIVSLAGVFCLNVFDYASFDILKQRYSPRPSHLRIQSWYLHAIGVANGQGMHKRIATIAILIPGWIGSAVQRGSVAPSSACVALQNVHADGMCGWTISRSSRNGHLNHRRRQGAYQMLFHRRQHHECLTVMVIQFHCPLRDRHHEEAAVRTVVKLLTKKQRVNSSQWQINRFIRGWLCMSLHFICYMSVDVFVWSLYFICYMSLGFFVSLSGSLYFICYMSVDVFVCFCLSCLH
jgi:hypothetical protein